MMLMPCIKREADRRSKQRQSLFLIVFKGRAAFALLEIMVAATLVLTGMVIIAKLSVASGRMWVQTRHERLAMEELSNQLEYLVALDADDLDLATQKISPADHVAKSLANVTILAKPVRDGDGSRIEMTIQWGDKLESLSAEEAVLQGRLRRLSLVGWIDPLDVAGPNREDEQ